MIMDIGYILTFIFYYFMTFCSVFWLVVFAKNYRNMHDDPEDERNPDVTIIIPAYNEERTIKNSIDSCINSDYEGEIKVIVVNDGSTDKTKKICEKYGDKILVINKENTGKANSINIGLEKVDTEIVGVLDADSFMTEKTIRSMMGYFKNEDVGAVTPSMMVDEERTLLQKIQWVEYVFSVYLRKVFSIVDAQSVCPGPGSLYRLELLKELGGFDENNLTEDMEIAFRIKQKGYIIENSLNAIVYTSVPESVKPLLKQRVRWYAGFYENMRKYYYMIFNREYGSFGTFIMPSNFVWTFAMFYITGYWGMTLINLVRQTIRNIASINFDLLPLINPFELKIDIFMLDPNQIFNIIFLVMGVIIIGIALRVARERPVMNKRDEIIIVII